MDKKNIQKSFKIGLIGLIVYIIIVIYIINNKSEDKEIDTIKNTINTEKEVLQNVDIKNIEVSPKTQFSGEAGGGDVPIK